MDRMTRLQGAVMLAGVLMAGCGSSSGAAANPAAPSVAALTVTGTWIGRDQLSTVTWVLTQTGASVTGASTDNDQRYVGQGTLKGTVTDGVFSFTDTYPALSNGCSLTVLGDFTINGAAMAGPYHGTDSCSGPFGPDHIAFTKQ